MAAYSFRSVIFDLDGVVTRTASVHGKAWKTVFDDYMKMREKRDAEPFREFTHESDYLPYVDGKPRYQGVKSFLESRNIHIPFGDASDPAGKETVCGVGNKKNDHFREILKRDGAEVFSSTIDLIKQLKEVGVKVGVASSSKNCKIILESVGHGNLFETRIDGVVSAELGLHGKPEGDIFVVAAEKLGTEPRESIVVEDATSGVQAGRNGGFGLVLGVARENNESDLLEHGADVVVRDISEINIEWIEKWFRRKPKPLPGEQADRETGFEPDPEKDGLKFKINPAYLRSGKDLISDKRKFVFFLDYDGTLTPIVSRPDLAVISKEMKSTVEKLSGKHMVAIVSGRMREDVEGLAEIKDIFYAGSHGFDILGPGFSMIHPKAKEAISVVAEVIEKLSKKLSNIEGLIIEKKKFSVAVHYRLVDEAKHLPQIKAFVENIAKEYGSLCLMKGKKVFELLPNISWDKGQAIRWIMKALKLSWKESSCVYIGDDVTDEYAFRSMRTRGTGILVSKDLRPSAADFWLSSPDEVRSLFEKIIALPS
ncbi:MAG: trehalose-phosphatase [Candidatus Omnitrophica bacterium]|nr:trehalose-phosphatase [Candidatus Omnitrophota bacterium]